MHNILEVLFRNKNSIIEYGKKIRSISQRSEYLTDLVLSTNKNKNNCWQCKFT